MNDYISQIPAGLERAILRILSFHKGKNNAISRDDLLSQIYKAHGIRTNDRTVRVRINKLRNERHLICSNDDEGGYFMAINHQEVNEFCNRDLLSKARNLEATVSIMRSAAEYEFGRYSPEMQMRMV